LVIGGPIFLEEFLIGVSIHYYLVIGINIFSHLFF